MRNRLKRPLGLATIALSWTLVACEQSPAGPEDATFDAVSLSSSDPRNPRGGTGTEQLNTLQQLLQQAFRKAYEEGGDAAVRALRAQLQPFHEAVRRAMEAGDRAVVRRALNALRAEEIGIVVRVLGPSAPRGVLETGARLIADATAKIQAAKAAGRDVTRLEALLRAVVQLHADGTAALQAGNLPTSLDLALQALDGARNLLRVLGR